MSDVCSIIIRDFKEKSELSSAPEEFQSIIREIFNDLNDWDPIYQKMKEFEQNFCGRIVHLSNYNLSGKNIEINSNIRKIVENCDEVEAKNFFEQSAEIISQLPPISTEKRYFVLHNLMDAKQRHFVIVFHIVISITVPTSFFGTVLSKPTINFKYNYAKLFVYDTKKLLQDFSLNVNHH